MPGNAYIAAITESGAQVFFRLGESIDHSGEDKYINPPENYIKWAQICEHIVRHYNEGWAGGFHYNIVYWEIWNEPDNRQMWTGNIEQYYEPSAMGGAFIASSLITLQKSPVDLAMYYDGQYAFADIWCGLYDSNGEKEPGYYAFDFYNRLCRLGKQVRMDEGLSNFYCCAAAGEKDGILLANFDPEKEDPITVRLMINGGGKKAVITRVNEENPNGKTVEENWSFKHAVLKIEAGEFIYIELN